MLGGEHQPDDFPATQGTVDIAVYCDSLIKGGVYAEADLIARAVRVFDGLRADALPWSMTRDLLREVGENYGKGGYVAQGHA